MHSEKFMLSDLPDYFIGEEGDLKHYKEVRPLLRPKLRSYSCTLTVTVHFLCATFS